MNNNFSNYAMHIGERYDHPWYDWCIFVSSDAAELNQIAEIEYTLDPSFPDPVRTISDKGHRFALMSNGWGSFYAHIRITYIDGRKSTTRHLIDVHESWPLKTPENFNSELEKQIYAILTEGKFRWRSVDTIQKRTGATLAQVSEGLMALEAENFARKSPIRSIDKKELWGATQIVGIAPVF